MAELKDYSGDFNPNLKMQDFTKDALVASWRTAGKLYIGMDGIWYTIIREKFGEKMALELESEVWRRNMPLEVRRLRETMNIQGDDVAALLKVCQVDPEIEGIMDMEYELKDNNSGILTFKRCASLEYFERHGLTETQKYICEVLDVEALRDLGHCVNPNMKCTPLKLPPRKSQDEIACQWEFKL